METFIHPADIENVRNVHEPGLMDGVTTNPSLLYDTYGFDTT